MRVYLDNCCFNRPYDGQDLLKVRLETQSKLNIQKMVLDKKIELAWSFILEYENDQNPYVEKREWIEGWSNLSVIDCDFTPEISEKSKELIKLGLREKDSLHIASAIFTKADYFITVDAKILNKNITDIKVINPVEFIYLVEETHED